MPRATTKLIKVPAELHVRLTAARDELAEATGRDESYASVIASLMDIAEARKTPPDVIAALREIEQATASLRKSGLSP